MWYEYLDNNTFIKKLYVKVPSLKNVSIIKISISDEGNRVTMLIDMPLYAENPPLKWVEKGYNALVVELDFFCINIVNMDKDETFDFLGFT